MNPTDAEIAGKLTGMECDGLKIYRNSNNWVWIRNPNNPFSDGMTANASKFLSFCRAVVERMDGERFTVEETAAYLEEHLDLQLNIRNKNLEEAIRFIKDELCGIAATTARHRKVINE